MRDFELVLAILLIAALTAPVARRLHLPLAIAQVLCGLLLSALPFLPAVDFDPDVIFTVLVPPLVYRASATTSLRDTRRLATPIFVLAIVLVIITTLAVGAVAHLVFPALSWSAAFVLGAIVSPPDADVTTSLARRLGLPARLVTILEGETLLNDATAFVLYRMAIAAAVIGSFSLRDATLSFLRLTIGGVAVGLACGWLVMRLRGWLRDTLAEVTISLLTPFAVYVLGEWLGVSGVLTVVVTGFCVSRFLPRTVTAATRERAILLWELVAFMVGGFIFLVIGLRLGQVIPDFFRPDGRSLLWMVAVVTATIVVTRFGLVLLSMRTTPNQRKASREEVDLRSPRVLMILTWAGLRGGDSLVMVLALPLVTAAGAPFPARQVIITVAFGVILATLGLQGITLRPLIRLLALPRDLLVDQEERQGRLAAEQAALARLEELASVEGLSSAARSYIEISVRQRTRLGLDDIDHARGHDGTTEADVIRRASRAVRDAARLTLLRMRDDETIGDAALSRILADLDLDDLRSADTATR